MSALIGFNTKGNHSSRQTPTEQASRNCTCIAATISSVIAIVAVFGLTSYNILHNQYSQNQYEFLPGDEMAISSVADDLSTKFCSEYRIGTFFPANAFLLPSQATVDVAYRKKDHFELKGLFHPVISTHGYYLLQNSLIEAHGCQTIFDKQKNEPSDMIILKGEDANRHWRPGFNNENEVMHVTIPGNLLCNKSTHSQFPRMEYTVEEEDVYYIVLYERSRSRQRTTVNGTISRTSYDVSGATSSCLVNTDCRFDLNFNDGDIDIVIKLRDGRIPPEGTFFTTKCELRVVFWVGIFGGIPIVLLALIIFFWVWLFCFKLPARQKMRHHRRAVAPQDPFAALPEADDKNLVRHAAPLAMSDVGNVTVQEET